MNSNRAALANQQAGFQNQVEPHKKIIFKIVSAFAWQPEDQQDLAQEIMLQLWRSYPRYNASTLFSTWMYQVSLNTAISWSRKTKARNRRTVTTEDLTEVPAASQAHSMDSHLLYSLIDTLDELSRALLLLYIEERTHSEIGEILGISEANVSTKLTRLKQRLRLEADQTL